jgi:sortase A
VLGWVGNIAAIVILFAVWQLWGSGIVQRHEQEQLASQFHTRVAAATSDASHSYVGLLPRTKNVAAPSEGSVTAQLQIPSIGVDQFVVEGTATGDLTKGPGHYTGTAIPGQAGNVAIAGHRTTFGAPFRRLDELHPGEAITLTTTRGHRLAYVVAQPPTVVSPNDNAILDDFGDNRLTLSTSDPHYTGTERLVVVALFTNDISAGGAVSGQPVGGPPGELVNTKTAGWNMSRLPVVLAIVIVLLLMGIFFRRIAKRLRRLATVIIFIPLGAAGIYFLFQALTYFMPSTL